MRVVFQNGGRLKCFEIKKCNLFRWFIRLFWKISQLLRFIDAIHWCIGHWLLIIFLTSCSLWWDPEFWSLVPRFVRGWSLRRVVSRFEVLSPLTIILQNCIRVMIENRDANLWRSKIWAPSPNINHVPLPPSPSGYSIFYPHPPPPTTMKGII